MTLRLTIGIDPGLSGALAFLADGEPNGFLEMPTRRVEGNNEVDAMTLARELRALRAKHSGAAVTCILERVQAMPTDGRTSAFKFGEGFGKVKAVLETLGIPYKLVTPPVWKRHFGILKEHKDSGRQLAIVRFPSAEDSLRRKKDQGRAEALLMALYLEGVWFNA